jgi:DNA-binding LytR/AlgR family response regulator
MNIAIVEDERVAARRLERLIRESIKDQPTSIALFESLQEAQLYLEKNLVDILFLDLNLQGRDGFDLLKSAVSEAFQTIIVSANTDRAIEAYEYGVLDFIPKPFTSERLKKAFERLEHAEMRLEHAATVIVVKNQGRLQLIPLEQINFLQGAGDYAELHLQNGTVVLHSKSLEALTRILPETFTRIHKSYIADINQIDEFYIYGGGKYECKLKNGTVLPVSRTRYRELVDIFNTLKKK